MGDAGTFRAACHECGAYMIVGETVKLYEKTQTGTDEYGESIYSESPIEVNDVLIQPTTSEQNVNNMSLYGKMAAYTLSIPKGDEHSWEDTTVEFYGRRWRTFGIPIQYTDVNTPLRWNKEVKVERYE